ncbi:MAG: hypothetical protein NTZ74_01725 [Chloroflexi bacterium]|nr:hypothetical protein [Chloroflexota bacterium]
MSLSSLLVDGGTILLGAGIFLLLSNLFSLAAEMLARIGRRTFASWTGSRLRSLGILQEKPGVPRSALDWKRLVILSAFLLLALSVRDVMLSPLVLLAGGAILFWQTFQQKLDHEARINEDAQAVALQIRSLMGIDHSLHHALLQVKLPPGILKGALGEVANRLGMNQSPLRAAQALSGIPGNVTLRLAALIANHARLTDAVQESLLLSLEQEARRAREQHARIRQSLSLVRGTIRILEGAAALSAIFVMLAPAWRDFFLQDLSHRLLLFAAIGVVLLAGLYFEVEVYQMGRGEGE